MARTSNDTPPEIVTTSISKLKGLHAVADKDSVQIDDVVAGTQAIMKIHQALPDLLADYEEMKGVLEGIQRSPTDGDLRAAHVLFHLRCKP